MVMSLIHVIMYDAESDQVSSVGTYSEEVKNAAENDICRAHREAVS